MTWYVIKTNPNSERKAADELRRVGIRVYVPKRTIERGRRGATSKTRPLLIGYVLARFPEELLDGRGVPPFMMARDCRGVQELMRWTNTAGERAPLPLPDKVVIALMRRQRGHEFDDAAVKETARVSRRDKFRAAATVGGHARVIDGAFAGFEAVIESVGDAETVTALLSIFGRATRVIFENGQLALDPVVESAKAA